MTRARVYRLFVVSALLTAALVAGGCGKKGPPRPPIRVLPSAPRQMSVRQIGDEVILAARLPGSRPDGTPLGPDTRVRVLRLQATSSLRPGSVSDRYLLRQFEQKAAVLATLEGEALREAAPEGRLSYRDREVIPRAAAGVTARYLYSVRILDAKGKGSRIPRPLLIEPISPPPVPRDLVAETAEGEVRLAWAEATGGEGARFNVYRENASDGRGAVVPLTRTPIAGTVFVDRTFRYGESYSYFVRRVEEGGPPMRESADSERVRIRPLDRFPPAPPAGLAVALEGSVIRLYWFPNSEPDLAGYRVYRWEAPVGVAQPEDEEMTAATSRLPRILLGETGPDETSFTDSTAAAGVRYHYMVTAVDGASPPNESDHSDVRSEMLPSGSGRPDDPVPARPEPGPGGSARHQTDSSQGEEG